jgi:branched-chain amino acid transport system ATP-binding protein
MILELSEVTKRFGGLVALKDVSFVVKEGEILGLIGPNGAGKTTLFNVICGFYKPNSGRIKFEVRDVTGFPPYKLCRLGIGRTFQTSKPFLSMTVFENVETPFFFRKGKNGSVSSSTVDEILKLIGLYDKRDYHVESLTHEDRKRMEIARALATRPKLLLLDEVLAGLNQTEVTGGMELIRSINKSGVAVVMIEHVMRAVMGISNRIVVLDHGESIAEGSPSEIAEDERVVNAYLGSETFD